MRINTNLNAMTALNSATKNTALAGSSMEKLSSGLKINKAADNATGLAISEKMRSQIRGLDQASQNTQDGISVVQTAEGAIEEVGNIVQRMRELAVQGANETNTGSDRAKISEELTQLHEEIDRIAESTQFNGKDLLNGTNTVRVENGHTITKETTGTDANKISNIEIQDGFDFDDLGTEVKIKTIAANGQAQGTPEKIEILGAANDKYKITADGLQTDGKINAKSTITITDSNGKSIKFTVGNADINQANDIKLGTKAATTENISGKEISLQVGANTSDSQTLKVKINNNKISITGKADSKYGVGATNIEGTKVKQGGVITITDSNGKSIKFTVTDAAGLDLNTDTVLGKKEATTENIAGKEISLQVGANTSDSQTLKVKIENVSTDSLGLNGDTITKMAKEGKKGTDAANTMIKSLDKALERVNTSRANLGAMQNRLETTASNLTTSNENLTAAESRIRDVDVAEEMMNLSKLNLINQAAQAMMSQAKSQPEGVMQLLR